MKSTVDHPAYYGGEDNPYEAIKIIEALDLGFCLGNAIKYIVRAGEKDTTAEAEDLRKAVWYLERRIQQLGKAPPCPHCRGVPEEHAVVGFARRVDESLPG